MRMNLRAVYIKAAFCALLAVTFIGAKPIYVKDSVYVYSDFSAGTNNFLARGLISSQNQEGLVHDLNEACTEHVYSGDSCIEVKIDMQAGSWGGWLFTNGYRNKDTNNLETNFGEKPNCGIDLSGASELVFAARGAKGGEKVEFFMGGLGYDADTNNPLMPYPDSTQKISSGLVQLTTEYQEFTIPLSGKDLSYIGCGFGVVAASGNNSQNTVFYIDEIRYRSSEKKNVPTEIIVAVIGALGAVAAASAAHLIRRKAKQENSADDSAKAAGDADQGRAGE